MNHVPADVTLTTATDCSATAILTALIMKIAVKISKLNVMMKFLNLTGEFCSHTLYAQ